jgi:hypothetical protein
MCEPESQEGLSMLHWLADDEGVATEHKFHHDSSADEWVLFNYDMIGKSI